MHVFPEFRGIVQSAFLIGYILDPENVLETSHLWLWFLKTCHCFFAAHIFWPSNVNVPFRSDTGVPRHQHFDVKLCSFTKQNMTSIYLVGKLSRYWNNEVPARQIQHLYICVIFLKSSRGVRRWYFTVIILMNSTQRLLLKNVYIYKEC